MDGPRGAEEFLGVATDGAAADLDRLLALPALPTSRDQDWHAVASVLLVTVDGRVLLARNRYGWGTVGGHVEATDATLREAAAREALEEIGLLLLPADLQPLSLVVDERDVVPGCAHWDFCFILVLATPVEPSAQSDVTAAAWFPLDDLPDVNDHMQRHLDAVRTRLESRALQRDGHHSRVAVRGIIQHGTELLLLRAGTRGDVKFPGGGVEADESHEQALSREVREECGRVLLDCGPPAIVAVQSHPDRAGSGIFTMVSHYLPCRVADEEVPASRQPYEEALDLRPAWLAVDEAIAANEAALADGRANPWASRELAVLRLLRGSVATD